MLRKILWILYKKIIHSQYLRLSDWELYAASSRRAKSTSSDMPQFSAS